MDVIETALPGVLVLTPRRFGDARGFFTESWSRRAFEAAGVALDWTQDNHSWSAKRGTLRGLHCQTPPFAQDKLVRVVRGAVLDVAVDIRRGSPHYGRWVGVELSRENGRQILVPKGFLHGFVTLSDDVDVTYKVSAPYSGPHDAGVIWSDPDLAIDWGVDPTEVTLSDKDARAPRLADFANPFVHGACA